MPGETQRPSPDRHQAAWVGNQATERCRLGIIFRLQHPLSRDVWHSRHLIPLGQAWLLNIGTEGPAGQPGRAVKEALHHREESALVPGAQGLAVPVAPGTHPWSAALAAGRPGYMSRSHTLPGQARRDDSAIWS